MRRARSRRKFFDFDSSICACVLISALVLCDISYVTCKSRIRLEENGYTGIVVAISPDVVEQNNNLTQLFASIESTFRAASSYLFIATEMRAFFENITILLPYNTPVLNNARVSDAFDKFVEADFVVQGATGGPFIGNGVPFTLQYGGCGQPGRYVHLPVDFFREERTREFIDIYGPKHKVLVHEWAHYRYGVFDEYGFPGDTRYPPMFSTPNGEESSASDDDAIQFTTCTNTEVGLLYDILPSKDQCVPDQKTGQLPQFCSAILRYRPDDPEILKIHSSIMYQQGMANVVHFCNATSHKQGTPTKQNALCREQPTWSVIETSPDLSNGTSQVNIRKEIPTTFHYVVENMPPQVMAALDMRILSKSSVEYIRFMRMVWREFLESLPVNVTVSLVGHHVDAVVINTLSSPVTLNVDNKTAIDRIADAATRLQPMETSATCISCLVSNATNKFLKDRVGGILILQIDAKNARIHEDLQTSMAMLLKHKIRLHLVLYPAPSGENARVSQLEAMAHQTQGKVYSVQHEEDQSGKGSIKTLVSLINAFADSIKGYSWDSSYNTIVIKSTELEDPQINFEFEVDQSLSGSTIQMAVISSHSLLDDSGGFILPDGVLIAPDGSEYPFLQTKTMSAKISIPPGRFSNGTWRFKANNLHRVYGTLPFVIRATAIKNKRAANAITVDAWTSLLVPEATNGSAALIVYASVHRGMEPVRNAIVHAIIHKPNGDPQIINLIDDGLGDPDITMWDGIYSSYVTSVSEDGGYHQVEIMVKATENTELIQGQQPGSGSLPLKSGHSYCCGSFVPAGNTISTGKFERKRNIGYIYVPPSAAERILFSASEPSRISDLRVSDVDVLLARATLTWTAPGGERNLGSADGYQIKCDPGRIKIRDAFDKAEKEILAWEVDGNTRRKPKLYGTPEELIVNIRELGTSHDRLYFGIRAVKYTGDNTQMYGPVSNIVEVDVRYMPWKRPTTVHTASPPEGTTTKNGTIDGVGVDDTTASKPSLSGTKMGLAIGIPIALLTLAIIVVIFLLFWRKKKKAPEESNRRNSPFPETVVISGPGDTSSGSRTPEKMPDVASVHDEGISPIQSWPASILLEHYDRVQEAKQRNMQPPIMTENALKELPNFKSMSNSIYGKVIDKDRSTVFPNGIPGGGDTEKILRSHPSAPSNSSSSESESIPPVPPPHFRRNVTEV